MSFRDEMSEISARNQYVFSQKQVEACADELYEMIKRYLKAKAAAGSFYKGGLFGTKKYVECQFWFSQTSLVLPQKPYIDRERSRIIFHEWGEVSALIKALKSRAAIDGIVIRKVVRSSDDYGAGENVFVSATYTV